MSDAGQTPSARAAELAQRTGPWLLFAYGFAVAFWLWAKWLFSPQMFFLPALPPVEVLILLVEGALGPWLVLLFTLSGLGLIAFDGVRARRAGRIDWWARSLLRGTAATVLIHIAIWIAGTILFFAVFALLPGSELRGKSANDPVVHGLLLFAAFLSLLMSGPITALAAAARALSHQKEDGYPPVRIAALNHALAVLIVPLTILWLVSGYPSAALESLRQDSAAREMGRSATLLAAAREGDAGLVRSLLRRGTGPDTRDASGATALIAAAANGHLEVVQLLLQAGANVKASDSSGRTALMSAAANRSTDVVQLLLKSGAAVNQQDSAGKTALMLAASSGHEPTLLGLLGAGAEVNARSANGETALIAAARAGNAGIARVLLAAGADPSAEDVQGNSALAWATKMNHQEVAKTLVKYSPKTAKP
jgi:hypothetical protein